MCTTCGCGTGEARVEGETVDHDHEHVHADGTRHSHTHDHAGGHGHGDGHEHAHGADHDHWHQHGDGSWHNHAHDHDGSHGHAAGHEHAHDHDEAHGHAHVHADGTQHSHPHDHGHGAGHEHAHGHEHGHQHADGSWHSHDHDGEHEHEDGHAQDGVDLDYGQGPARTHAPGISQARMVQIEQDILGKNNSYADDNRTRLSEQAVLALNLVSSPGSGKTTLLTRTLTALKELAPLAVIEGDQETAFDAERIRATGVPAIQVNTGKGCHLDAKMVGHAMERLELPAGGYLFIENVGNLVCPAAFDLGEAAKVAILSVTEGADKPLKYPDMFHAASLMLINKIDLLPYVDFDVERAIAYARQVNPQLEVLQVSATSGEGFDAWLAWLAQYLDRVKGSRIAALEAELARLKGA
jgi:hydrogenase nickel incorporation protein HypB